MNARTLILGAALAAAAGPAAPSLADDVKLPATVAWSTYNTDTTGYKQSVAIGKALKDKFGTILRVVPGKDDVSRLTPLRNGQVQFVANGGTTYFAFEGLSDFAAREWGPQPVQLLMSASSDANVSVATAKDANIRAATDIKGKRVAWVRGADALNLGVEAVLAFGGLTWNDVTKVEFPGFAASWAGIVNGQADAALASTVSGAVKKLAASPRGIHWPPLPHADETGWQHLLAVAPYFVKHTATIGAGISEDNPHEGGAYPYPVLITLAGQDDALVYSMAKAINSQYANFKDAMPALKGWALERQVFKWAVPYHNGAVKYWKEIGAWTADMDAHNNQLLKRQEVLAAAWTSMKNSKTDGEAFTAEWAKARAAALTQAGFNP
jgi:uncharacterized protein